MWRTRASVAGLLLSAAALACAERPAPVAAAGPLQWIEDDAPRALEQAKRLGVPIFVEAWAPW